MPRRERGSGPPGAEKSLQGGFFEGLRADDIVAVAAAAHRHRVAKRAFFFQQGNPAGALYVLTEGRAKILQTTMAGRPVLLSVVGLGDVFGESTLFGETQYAVTAEAMTACEALWWAAGTIVRLMARYPRIAVNAVRLLGRRLDELQDRYRELATERVEQRIARAVLRLGRQIGRRNADGVLLDLALSRDDLAGLAGTTLYTVSRVVSSWQKRGLVKAGRTLFLIRRPNALVAIADDLGGPH
ncbi:MAG: Crp/Fnr family transcriptional regulator [Candidatus Rokuibacteriota bacterium]|nr:MAG: Crp/Fnr family transcriptional regulator [Candidatus Rokubacteria bacterium]